MSPEVFFALLGLATLLFIVIVAWLSITKRRLRSQEELVSELMVCNRRLAEEGQESADILYLTISTSSRNRTRVRLREPGRDSKNLLQSPAGYSDPNVALSIAERIAKAKLVVIEE